MINTKDIRPRNSKGRPHGIWETYHDNGQLQYKGTYVNGLANGFFEEYGSDGGIDYKCTYINNDLIDYDEWFTGRKIFHLI